jgi:hypothetical protein
MSALCQKQTSADLFDHLVGQHEEVVWHFDPERPGGFEINNELKFGRLLHRDVAGLGPAQNLIDQLGGTPKQAWIAWPIAEQKARWGTAAGAEHRRQSSAQSQRIDTSTVRSDQCIDGDIEDVSAVLNAVERRRNVLWSRDLQCDDFEAKRAGGGLDLSQFLFGSRLSSIYRIAISMAYSLTQRCFTYPARSYRVCCYSCTQV